MENHTLKKNVSNEKRLESLKLKTKQNKLQQNLIQSALSEIDSGKSINRRIVFETDDEEELQNGEGNNNKFVHSYNNEDKIQLFTDSDSDNSSNSRNNLEDVFSRKPQFEGKKGQELWQLQSRFKNDERFQLDQRFVDSEGEEDESIKEDETTETMDITREREKNFEILQDVLGVQFPTKSAEKKLEKYRAIKDTSRLRYDPTREDAGTFEIKRESKEGQSSNKKKKQKKADPEPVVLPEVSKQQFFNVAPNLKDAFNDTSENRKFSFLKEFNNQDFSDEEDTCNGNNNYFAEPFGKLKPTSFQRNAFKYDSTDNEDEDESHPSSQRIQEKPKESEQKNLKADWKFFFSSEDSRLKEGVEYFKRSGTDEEIEEWWRRTRATMLDLIEVRRRRKIYNRKTTVNKRRGKRGK